jgi:decaprenylphospho-beta-D-erythro-pentofuranosid-2-ulose 2-reductase
VTDTASQHGRAEGQRWPRRVLLLGGTSEIGQAILAAMALPADCEVLLAGRDQQRLAAAGHQLPCAVQALPYDATDLAGHPQLVATAFDGGPVDLVIAAAGVLISQDELDQDPVRAGRLIQTNFTGHVTALLAVAGRMRQQGHGTIVVLSSVAAIRPRRANYVYGAAKAGLDAFGRGLADAMHGTGVRVVLVRPGFVIGKMTAGMTPAPLSCTPAQVGAAVAAGLRSGGRDVLWVPPALRVLAAALRLLPRPLWRKLPR